MPYDANIITNVESPDFSDALVKGANMRSLTDQHRLQSLQIQQATQQFNDQKAIRTAEDNNTSVDLDTGAITKDRKGILADLLNVSPHVASQAQMQYAQQDKDIFAQKMAMAHAQNEAIGELSGGVKDQATLDAAHARAKAIGLDTSGIPETFDASTPQLMKTLQGNALSVQQQIENAAKARGQDIEELKNQVELKKMGIDIYKTYGKPMSNPASGYQPPNGNKPEVLSKIDPSTLIDNIPPDKKAEVSKEIAHAQNVSEVGPQLLDAQNKIVDALKNNDFRSAKAEQNRYSALMGAAFKEVEGTARQAAIDHMIEATMPTIGDKFIHGYDQRKQGLNGFISSGSAAPLAKSYGIDLNKYESTNISQKIAGRGQSKVVSSQSFEPDVVAYAEKHGISPEQAKSIKTQRMIGNK